METPKRALDDAVFAAPANLSLWRDCCAHYFFDDNEFLDLAALGRKARDTGER
jgi:hypothetical protein